MTMFLCAVDLFGNETLSPCDMCTGAILLYKIPRVVIGENKTFLGGEALLRERGVEVVVLDSQECKDLMAKFIEEHPEVSSSLISSHLRNLMIIIRSGMRILVNREIA